MTKDRKERRGDEKTNGTEKETKRESEYLKFSLEMEREETRERDKREGDEKK